MLKVILIWILCRYKGETPAWQDAELLRDIEGATGLDLGSSSASTSGGKGGKGGKGKGKGKKGKGKAKKYPGLTDIRKINNTSRNRLEKIVMNRYVNHKNLQTMDYG